MSPDVAPDEMPVLYIIYNAGIGIYAIYKSCGLKTQKEFTNVRRTHSRKTKSRYG